MKLASKWPIAVLSSLTLCLGGSMVAFAAPRPAPQVPPQEPPQNPPKPDPKGDPKGEPKNEKKKHPRLEKAIEELRAVKKHLEKAPHDFGGHRVDAVKAVTEAIKQLELAVKFDKN